MSSTAPTPATAQQALIDAAKASIVAYNNKDWAAVRSSITTDCLYDEVGTHRKIQGADDVLASWQAWAEALPDSKATFTNALASGNTAVIELTWRGTHTGPLQLPTGQVDATNKSIEVRACQVVELSDNKVQSIRQYFDMATLLSQLGINQ